MEKQKYDLIIIGAGPSGIFMAYELIKLGSKKNILIIEQGKKVEDRYCPIEKTGKCIKCKPLCNITNGFSGAGAFSDGKLSLYNEEDTEIHVGGNLHEYLGIEQTKRLIDYTDKIYLDFGADTKVEGLEYKDKVKEIAKKAKDLNITLYDVPVRHLGTEKAHELYHKLQTFLLDNNVNIMFETVVSDLIVVDNAIKGVKVKPAKYVENEEYTDLSDIYSDTVVIGVGRKGAKWLSDMCRIHKINSQAGIVDIGIRYELPDKYMADINKYMYEAKFVARLEPYKDKIRTFCQNPSGFVSTEVYDKNITLVNGHSYKDRKSTNTNLALLCSHKFNYPFNEPIKYGRNVAENSNQLGNGNILVLRLGDILNGKRTWEKELQTNSVTPTLASAVAGDITYALGYRTMTNILAFIRELDKVIPGFAHPDNLLYSPEIKFYSNHVVIDSNFETSIKNLYSIGDGGGLTRGLMMASCSGVHLARIYNNR
jgi:uncharacterized FAD-dependent dehydrogenase